MDGEYGALSVMMSHGTIVSCKQTQFSPFGKFRVVQ